MDLRLLFPFLSPAEEFDVHLFHRLPSDRIAREIVRTASQLFLQEGGVVHPQHHSVLVAAVHLRGDQIRPSLLQRRCNGDPSIKMPVARLQIEIPGRDLFAEKFRFILFDDSPTNVFDLQLLPVQILGSSFEVGPQFGEEVVQLDRLRLEVDDFAIAVKIVQDGTLPRGLTDTPFKSPPRLDDLIKSRDAVLLIPRPEFVDRRPPLLRSLGVLLTIFVNLRQLLGSERRVGLIFVARCQFLQPSDRIVFVRQLDSPHAGGQPHNRFVIG